MANMRPQKARHVKLLQINPMCWHVCACEETIFAMIK